MKYELLDRPIAFHRGFVKPAGSVNAALLLSQMFYWNNRTTNPDGWFYKTAEDFEEETGLSRKEQSTARRQLRELNWVEERLYGVPATLHFRLTPQFWLFVETSFTQTVNPDSPKGENWIRPKGKTNTVITTETTKDHIQGENQGELDLVPVTPAINKHQKIMDLYNAAAEEAGLPRCTVLNASRKRQIDARLTEYPSPKQWAPVFQTVRNFKRRVDDGDRMGWFSFDWIIKSSVNFDKVAADWLAGIPTDKQRGAQEQKKNRPSNAHYEGTDSLVHRTIAARTIKVDLFKPETV